MPESSALHSAKTPLQKKKATLYTASDLARDCGLRASTIRMYEKMKLIRPVRLTEAGYKIYDPLLSKERVESIRRLMTEGMTLEMIQDKFARMEGRKP